MSQSLRNLILILVVLWGLSDRSFAADTSIAISGSETQVSGSWDAGAITITVNDSAGNSYMESVVYGQFSVPASIASAMAAQFSRDYAASGLCAHAVGPVIYFHLKGSSTFGTLSVTNPSASFAVTNVSVASSGTPSTFGAPVIFTASVSGGATGTVSFYDADNLLGTGTISGNAATYTTSSLAGGTHSITAVWTPSASNAQVISDPFAQTVVAVNADGRYIYTVAGNGIQGYSGDGGAATAAELMAPVGVALDQAGNLYISDFGAGTVREVMASNGNISTVAGSGSLAYNNQPQPATSVWLPVAGISGVAVDLFGNTYITTSNWGDNDSFNGVVKVTTSTGVMTTEAGNGPAGSTSSGQGNGGLATNAEFGIPTGVAFDPSGNLFILDSAWGVVREVTASNGIINPVAGGGSGCSQQTDNLGDGCPATSADIDLDIEEEPSVTPGIATDSSGNLYIADVGNNRIRKVTVSTGIITTVAGGGSGCSQQTDNLGDGCPATSAELNGPYGVAVDASGNIFISDTGNSRIREVAAATGIITTVAGNGIKGYLGDGGPASAAELGAPAGIAVNPSGVLYFADEWNSVVRMVTSLNKTMPTITWATPSAITYGTALNSAQLNATANVPGTFSYTPANGAVLTAGPQPLWVTFTPTDTTDYNVAQASVTLPVNRATPAITWPSPSDVAKGTALSGTQLNASSNVAGTFAYSPSQNTVLVEGPNTLTATFTPNDLTDYNIVTAKQYVTVTQDPGTWDTGTVTLAINNTVVGTTSYTQGATPTSIAEGLAKVASSSLVSVTAVDDALYIEALTPGSGSNGISYTIANGSYASTNFAQPSFPASTISGNLEGGANSSANGGATIYKYNVPTGGYDGVGNLLNYTDSTVMGAWTMKYDHLDRLSLATQTPVTGSAQSFCWTFDAFGNRTAQTVSSQPFTNAAGASTCQQANGASLLANTWQTYSTANNNRMASTNARGVTVQPVYDAVGNVTYDGVNQYLYDGDGRICAVASTAVAGLTTMTGYIYDADGTRTSKGTITQWSCDPAVSGFTPTNDYVLGVGGEQVTEMAMGSASSGTTSSAMAWQHTNVYASGNLMATYDKDGLHFYLDDPLGTRRVQTDYAGVVEQTCQSWPFGDQLACTGSTQYPTEHHFTGKERDAESGNDYFGARYYASSMGRWMSPDADFTLKRILPNPQRWNRYAYVHNNPLAFFDPDGLQDFAVFLTYSPSDRGGHPAVNWNRIQADAVKHGNTVTIHQGKDANPTSYQKALSSGQTTVVIGHTDLADIGDGNGARAQAVRFSDGSVGNPNLQRTDGAPSNAPESVNGGTVAIFGCDSGNLAGQYSGADSFVGVDSGIGTGQPGAAAFETSIPGLLAAGSTFVDSLASGDSVSTAVNAANKVIDQNPKLDTGDRVTQQNPPH